MNLRKKRNTLDDLHIIHQLETQYGEEIPEVPYGHRGIGYHMNITGRVVSLNLFEELEDTTLLGELKHLQRLSLRDAQITNRGSSYCDDKGYEKGRSSLD